MCRVSGSESHGRVVRVCLHISSHISGMAGGPSAQAAVSGVGPLQGPQQTAFPRAWYLHIVRFPSKYKGQHACRSKQRWRRHLVRRQCIVAARGWQSVTAVRDHQSGASDLLVRLPTAVPAGRSRRCPIVQPSCIWNGRRSSVSSVRWSGLNTHDISRGPNSSVVQLRRPEEGRVGICTWSPQGR